MTTPAPASAAPGTPDETGAVRARKKRAALLPLWILLGVLALIAIALILYFSLRGGSGKKSATPLPVPLATSTASTAGPTDSVTPSDTSLPSDTSSPADPTSPADTTVPAATAPAAATASPVAAAPIPSAAGVVAGNFVGGDGKSPVKATGQDAEPGDTGTVLFGENSANIDAQGKKVIASAAATLKAGNAKKVEVTGYTDTVAGTPVNNPLSQERADKVAAVLRADLGPGVTVTTSAKGEADPAATNSTADGRGKNRRAVISAI